jgi:hypothetical protein
MKDDRYKFPYEQLREFLIRNPVTHNGESEIKRVIGFLLLREKQLREPPPDRLSMDRYFQPAQHMAASEDLRKSVEGAFLFLLHGWFESRCTQCLGEGVVGFMDPPMRKCVCGGSGLRKDENEANLRLMSLSR